MLPKWITEKIIPRCLRKVSHTFVSNLLHIMLGIQRKCETELLFKKYVLLVSPLLLLAFLLLFVLLLLLLYCSCWLVLLLACC
jgi:hypothetical protein